MKKILLLAALFLWLASCGTVGNNTDIINPEAEYLYFFWATCPHCQELNKILNEQDLYSQVSIEKREVWYNEENQKLFQDKVLELWLKESETGVPFIYDTVTGEHAIGVDPALQLLKSRLNNIVETETSQANSEASPQDVPDEIEESAVETDTQEEE